MTGAVAKMLTKFKDLRSRNKNVEFIYKDMGAAKIGERLDELNNLSLTIGFQGATAMTMYPDGRINVATVALFNEFGTQNMPARGFMRRAIAENLAEIQNEFAVHFAAVVELREKPIEAMDAIGRFVAEKMVEAIDTASTWAAPLAPSTVKSKGHAEPLFETGLMKKSITWAVHKNGFMGPIVKQGRVR